MKTRHSELVGVVCEEKTEKKIIGKEHKSLRRYGG
jgi:hypothetical protein